MKTKISILLCLVFFSLACLGSAASSSIDAAPIGDDHPTLTNVPMVEDDHLPTLAPTLVTDRRCAVVIADESLHLRGGPSEDDIVLTWLKSGEELQLLSNSDPDWWRVRFEGFEGFARSIYLQESECVKWQ